MAHATPGPTVWEIPEFLVKRSKGPEVDRPKLAVRRPCGHGDCRPAGVRKTSPNPAPPHDHCLPPVTDRDRSNRGERDSRPWSRAPLQRSHRRPHQPLSRYTRNRGKPEPVYAEPRHARIQALRTAWPIVFRRLEEFPTINAMQLFEEAVHPVSRSVYPQTVQDARPAGQSLAPGGSRTWRRH